MTNTADASIPREAKVISLILRSFGVEECEPKVILQILEFTYKYVKIILQDAKIYADYCNRENIMASDIKLAIQTKMGKFFVSPPPRQYMNEIASVINSHPLIEYESENLILIPNTRKALLNLDYEIDNKSMEKRKKK